MNAQLLKMIAEGEHQRQDFKYCINDSRKIAVSLVAFANTDGGRLLLGIRDNGSVAGVSSEEEYYMVEAAARLYSKPPVSFNTHVWKTEGKNVLEVKVDKSEQKPHFAQESQGKWLAYIRIKDQNIIAPKILLDVWKQEKSTRGVLIKFTEEEQKILALIEPDEKMSLRQLIMKSGMPKWKVSKILIELIAVGVVRIENTENGSFFLQGNNSILTILNNGRD